MGEGVLNMVKGDELHLALENYMTEWKGTLKFQFVKGSDENLSRALSPLLVLRYEIHKYLSLPYNIWKPLNGSLLNDTFLN